MKISLAALVVPCIVCISSGPGRGQSLPGEVVAQAKVSSTSGGFVGPLDDVDAFARAVAALGDLDGDGIVDLAVGALGDDDGGLDHGAVWILFLADDGSVAAESKISSTAGGFSGDLDSADWFGFAATSLGDLDGDGVVDLAVGAPRDDDGAFNAGAVWILFLDATGAVKSQTKISATAGGFAAGLDGNDLFGTSLANLGDLDGDGVVDLAVGAPQDDDGGVDFGAVWVLFLNTDGTVKGQSKISATAGGFAGALDTADQFAISLGALADPHGTGEVELAVGARADDDGGTDRGALWLLHLAADGSVVSQAKISSTSGGLAGPLDDGDFFGVSVISPGDLDGDGKIDWIVGANLDDDGGNGVGALYVLFMDGADGVRAETKLSATTGGFGGALDINEDFSISLAPLGDLDGDGTDDVAVGALWDDDGGVDRGAVWILFLDAAKWLDLGGGLAGGADEPLLTGAGTLLGAESGSLALAGALPFAPTFFVFGFAVGNAPFKGGTLVPVPTFVIGGLTTDAAGGLTLPFVWPAGVLSDFSTYLQFWIIDAAGPLGFAASNGLAAVTP